MQDFICGGACGARHCRKESSKEFVVQSLPTIIPWSCQKFDALRNGSERGLFPTIPLNMQAYRDYQQESAQPCGHIIIATNPL